MYILAALSALCGFEEECMELRGESGIRDMGEVREEGAGVDLIRAHYMRTWNF